MPDVEARRQSHLLDRDRHLGPDRRTVGRDQIELQTIGITGFGQKRFCLFRVIGLFGRVDAELELWRQDIVMRGSAKAFEHQIDQ